MCGRHQSSAAPVQPLPPPVERPRDRRNGYVPHLHGRRPPPYSPRTHHGQTSPLPILSLQTSLQSEKNKAACLATMWDGSHSLTHHACLSQVREVGQPEAMHRAVPCQARGKATGKEPWPLHTWGHSWENKLAISIARLPATPLGLGLNLLLST